MSANSFSINLPEGIENSSEMKDYITSLTIKIRKIRASEEKYLNTIEKDLEVLTSQSTITNVNNDSLASSGSGSSSRRTITMFRSPSVPINHSNENESLVKWKSILFDQALDIEYLYNSHFKSEHQIKKERSILSLKSDLSFIYNDRSHTVTLAEMPKDESWYEKIKKILVG